MNGSKTEKLRLSFHLLDLEGKGIISYLDFSRAVRKVMSLWYTMTGNQGRCTSYSSADSRRRFKGAV